MKTRSGFLLITTATAAAILLGACTKAPEPVVLAPAPPPAVAASNVSDVDMTEHVKTALRQSDVLKSFDITVVALKGDVRLTAVLDTQAQIDEALRIARASDGVHSLHDELTLKK